MFGKNKDVVRNAVFKARKHERKKTIEDCNDILKRKVDHVIKEYEVKLSNIKAELDLHERKLAQEKEKSKKADSVYRVCWEQIQNNVSLASKLQLNAKRIHSLANEIFKVAESLFDEAEANERGMIEKDKFNRKRLDLVK